MPTTARHHEQMLFYHKDRQGIYFAYFKNILVSLQVIDDMISKLEFSQPGEHAGLPINIDYIPGEYAVPIPGCKYGRAQPSNLIAHHEI